MLSGKKTTRKLHGRKHPKVYQRVLGETDGISYSTVSPTFTEQSEMVQKALST